MKHLTMGLAMVLVLGLAGLAGASNSSQITVTFEVSAINEVNIDSGVSLTVSAATAGSQPGQVAQSTTYDITTNGTGKKLTGAINTAMPSGVTLKVNVTAPSGGTGLGDVTLSATAADLVTGVTQVAESNISIAFKLSSVMSAGVVTSAQKTFTLTLTDGS